MHRRLTGFHVLALALLLLGGCVDTTGGNGGGDDDDAAEGIDLGDDSDMGGEADAGDDPDVADTPDTGDEADMTDAPDSGDEADMGDAPDVGEVPDAGDTPDMGDAPCVPQDEVCNGEDDDCDEAVDEGTGGGACETLLLGICRAGTEACVEGGIECVSGAEPGVEICDGLDNDCNGTPDDVEGLGEACAAGVGTCAVDGLTVCGDDGAIVCDAEPAAPGAELCNGLDDDCDGEVDDVDGLGAACAAGIGACATAGTIVCGADGLTCDAAPGEPREEQCNGLDDDCDGEVDDVDGLGDACAAGVGACAVAGTFVCAVDGLACDAAPGEPREEQCNGLDDDCDGEVDDVDGLGEPCAVGVGACERVGRIACTPDGPACDAAPGPPSPEVCGDAIDNDCNGATDELPACAPVEDCAAPGDEDGNGLADCADPACADAPGCRVIDCGALRVGITGGGFYHDELRVALDAEPDITAERVDDCSAENLANYAVLIIHGNRAGNCGDEAVLNAWVEGGGTLIGVPWVVGNNNSLDSLPVIGPRNDVGVGGYPADVLDPASPLVAGVDFDPGDGACDGQPRPISPDPDCVNREAAVLRDGANRVATVPGEPEQVLLAWWDYGAGRGIYVGYHYVTSDTYSAAAHPSGQRLMINAVRHARGCGVVEDCAAPGDEDDNGLADCLDPACADAPACQGTGCEALRVGITGGGFYHDELRVALDAEPDITAERVDDCAAENLADYAVLIIHGNRAGNCGDEAVLNAWAEGGGTLIGVPWVVGNNNSLDSLPVIGPRNDVGVGGYPADVLDPASPLVAGVDFDPGDGACDGQPRPISPDPDCVNREAAVLRDGANRVATVPGEPEQVLLAWWDYGAGRGIYVGYHYVTSDTYSAAAHPSGQRLMINAVRHARSCGGPAEARAACADNPLWRPVECQTDAWVWSNDRANVDVPAAEAARTLFTGCTHSGPVNLEGLCSLDGAGHVSVDTWQMQGCDADWWHLGGSHTGPCGGHDEDTVRRLVTADDGCYDYRDLPPPGPALP